MCACVCACVRVHDSDWRMHKKTQRKTRKQSRTDKRTPRQTGRQEVKQTGTIPVGSQEDKQNKTDTHMGKWAQSQGTVFNPQASPCVQPCC